jgi:hypothetical protein
MRDGWARVRLAEVATLDIDRVSVDPGKTYRIAGVWNAGQGLFARDEINGSQTNYPQLHRLRAGQLVMRKLTAWEGPITTVPADFDGFFVSTEFPTYTLGPTLDTGFMRLICQLPGFWEAMRQRSTGTVQRRKRVNPEQLLNVEIDLPPLAEQRRIVDLMGVVGVAVTAARRVASTANEALIEAVLAATTPESCPATARLADVAAILDARRVPVSEVERQTRRGSVPYYGANGRVGWIDHALFDEPLVLLAEDGGYYDEWRTRPVAYEIDGPAWVNNHAHILRAVAVTHDWLYFSLRHRDLTSIVNVGTRAKLNQAPLRDIPIGLVTDPVAACRHLRALHDVVVAADRDVAALEQLRTALLGSLLQESGAIPESYDRFLDGAA